MSDRPSHLSNKINVHFESIQPVMIAIKQQVNNPPVPDPTPLVHPSFFPLARMAAVINRHNPSPAAKVAWSIIEQSIAERLKSPAETMVRLLQPFTSSEKERAAGSAANLTHPASAQTGSPLTPVKSKSSRPAQPGLKPAEFNLEAPWAKSVKLAADFTEWEKCPLDLNKTESGVWSIIVWLAPGKYAYRFIVDNQWYDDPHSVQRTTNPFGTTNTVIHVH